MFLYSDSLLRNADKPNTFKGSCGEPEDIPKSQIHGWEFNSNDGLKYRCGKGYRHIGRPRRRFRADGKWSKAPKCLHNFPVA